MAKTLFINDNNLLVASSRVEPAGKGYAWLKEDTVVFDTHEADSPVRQCRIAPQEINNRYWQQCDQSSIVQNGAGMRHAADLIWSHLNVLRAHHDLDDVVLVVPSHYRESNLKLLLGVAQSSELSVAGVINKAALALSDLPIVPGNYRHVDVQLHQTVISRVSRSEQHVSLGEVDILQDVGIHLIQEALLKGLQQSFIKSERFDPLHDAVTEQQLFDQLPDIARRINKKGKATIGLQHLGRLHSTSIDTKEWNAMLLPFAAKLRGLANSVDGDVIEHNFFDLNAAFGDVAPAVFEAEGSTMLSAPTDNPERYVVRDPTDKVVYQTSLSSTVSASTAHKDRLAETAKSSSTIAESDTESVTHLLHAGVAISITSAHITSTGNALQIDNGTGNVEDMLSSGKLYIMNDEGRNTLQANDRLGSNMADGVITAIRVEA